MQENGHFASSNEMVRPGKCEKFVCSSALPMYIRFIHNYALDYTKPQFMQPIVHLLSLVNINNCTFYTVYINSSVGLFVKFSVLLLRFVIRFVASAYTLSIKAYTLSIKTIKAYTLSIKTIKAYTQLIWLGTPHQLSKIGLASLTLKYPHFHLFIHCPVIGCHT